MKFCPECGTKLTGSKFCPECGHDLRGISASEDTLPDLTEMRLPEELDFSELGQMAANCVEQGKAEKEALREERRREEEERRWEEERRREERRENRHRRAQERYEVRMRAREQRNAQRNTGGGEGFVPSKEKRAQFFALLCALALWILPSVAVICVFRWNRTAALIGLAAAVVTLFVLKSRIVREKVHYEVRDKLKIAAIILVVVTCFELLFIFGLRDVRINNNVLKVIRTNTQVVEVPDGVHTIGGDAFSGTFNTRGKKVEVIHLPDSVRYIQARAFADCPSLEEIYLNGEVESIGAQAFTNCPALKRIYFDGTEEEWNAIEKNKKWDNGMAKCEIIFLK